MGRVRGALIVAVACLGLLAGCIGDGDSEPERAQQPREGCDLIARGARMFVRLSGERAHELCPRGSGRMRRATGGSRPRRPSPAAATGASASFTAAATRASAVKLT
jgi:hypothetical protein